MNILIAADYSTPGSGNFIGSLFELSSVLRKHNDTTVFIFPKTPNTENKQSWVNWLINDGYTVYLIDKGQTDTDKMKELKAIICKHSINILHVHFGLYHRLVLRHRNQIPTKIVVHDHMDFPYAGNRKKMVLSNTIRSAVYRALKIGVISVNPHKDSSYKLSKHWYIPNGLTQLRFLEKTLDREACRSILGIKANEKLCLFLGWDLYRKGLDTAVKAVAECRKSDCNIVLGVVGVGAPPTSATLHFIKKYTDIEPTSEWIRYFHSTEDMFAYHRAADVYISASRSEAFSYGILEAISQNTPIVVSDIPGTQWSWEFEHTFPYSVEDPVACAAAVQKALTVGRSKTNWAEIVEKYSIEKWCNAIINVYNTL